MKQNGELNRGGFLAMLSFSSYHELSGSKDETEIQARWARLWHKIANDIW